MSARRLLLLAACAGLGLAAWFGSSAGIQANPPAPPIVQLTNDHGIDARPSWSPDNRRIAFQSNHDSSNFHIYVMTADGSGRRQVTQGSMDDRHPVWMPDGKSILFDSDDGKVEEIWMVDLAGGRL